MKMDDDALDRAIDALPLEEPPADLRARILTATVYRPVPLFTPREAGLLGAGIALVAWLLVLVVLGGATLFVDSIQTIGSAMVRALSSGMTLAWVAAGGVTAVWISLFTGFQPSAKGADVRRH
jgi:hypothetical protein